MATKHSDIRIDDIVVTKATLKAMLLKNEDKEGKAENKTAADEMSLKSNLI